MTSRGWMVSVVLVGVLAAVAVSQGCAYSDLRSQAMVDGSVSQDDRAKGRALLESLARSHGGVDAWKAHRNARVVLSDTWFSTVAYWVAAPWSENGQTFEMTALLGTDNSRLVFMGGDDDGQHWGIQNWASYTADGPNATVRFEQDDDIVFWLPTIEFFIEAPFRLREAELVTWIGQRELQGRRYDLVVATWGQDAPQDLVDQYVAWIDVETGRLAYLTFTVRDFLDSMVGTMSYRDYRTVQGIDVAMTMVNVDEPGGDTTGHKMKISSIEFGVDVPDAFVVPEPERRRSKY